MSLFCLDIAMLYFLPYWFVCIIIVVGSNCKIIYTAIWANIYIIEMMKKNIFFLFLIS